MKAFSDLLERLLFSPGRNTKIALLHAYFASRPDPERGYALAAIAGALDFPGAKPATLRAMAESRSDPELFALSYDFVGDLAETVALIWRTRIPMSRPNFPRSFPRCAPPNAMPSRRWSPAGLTPPIPLPASR
jgi:DNA ligase-1